MKVINLSIRLEVINNLAKYYPNSDNIEEDLASAIEDLILNDIAGVKDCSVELK